MNKTNENVEKGALLYEGKAKKVFLTSDPELVIIHYKDDATAFNGEKKGTIVDKGKVNNRMTALIFARLEREGIPTHLVRQLNEREQLCRKVEIVLLEVIGRNVIAGSASKRLGLPEGSEIDEPIYEICYKNDALGDPLINDSHALAIRLATREELAQIYSYTDRINRILQKIFLDCGLRLIDFKFEFGRTPDGKIVLADEISPDTCRLWDSETNEKLDKDRFRRDLGGVESAYLEVIRRIEAELGSDNA